MARTPPTHRLLHLPAWLALAAGAALAGEPPAAAPAPITVATEVVSAEAPTKPGEMRAVLPPRPVTFGEQAPASLKTPVEAKGKAFYGETALGARKAAAVAAFADDGTVVLGLDADGDGAIGEGERSSPTPSPWTQGGVRTLGRKWRSPEMRVGGGGVFLEIAVPGGLSGAVSSSGPAGPGKPLLPVTPVTFSETRPAFVKTAPDWEGRILWAEANLGDGQPLAIEARRGPGDALAVAIDANRDGDLTGAGEVHEPEGEASIPPTGPMAGKRNGTVWTVAPVAVGDRTLAFRFSEAYPLPRGGLFVAGSRRGTATVAGVPFVLLLLDGDFDGAYGSGDDGWWFGPQARAAATNAFNVNNLIEANEPVFEGGAAFRLAAVAADGTATVVPAADAGTLEAYLGRRAARVNAKRWFPKFDEEREAFAKKRGLDLSRERAQAPTAWRHLLDLDEARAIAAKEGKPLLVDFEADWCEWCKRLDYYTYPDREVAARLAKFTAVKVNNELDPERAFDEMKDARGARWGSIPAVAVFGPDGKPLLFTIRDAKGEDHPSDRIPGWLRPDLFAGALDSAYAAWEKATGKTPPGAPPPPPNAPMDPSDKPAPGGTKDR